MVVVAVKVVVVTVVAVVVLLDAVVVTVVTVVAVSFVVVKGCTLDVVVIGVSASDVVGLFVTEENSANPNMELIQKITASVIVRTVFARPFTYFCMNICQSSCGTSSANKAAAMIPAKKLPIKRNTVPSKATTAAMIQRCVFFIPITPE